MRLSEREKAANAAEAADWASYYAYRQEILGPYGPLPLRLLREALARIFRLAELGARTDVERLQAQVSELETSTERSS